MKQITEGKNKAGRGKGRPFKPGNGGRPQGATNIITRTVKETMLTVFNEVQVDGKWPLKKFADKYPKEFYLIASKLIPTEIHAKINKVELHVIRTGADLSQNFTPAATEDIGHSEQV